MDDLVAKAEALAARILASARRLPDETPMWVSAGEPSRPSDAAVGPDVYGGTCGIVLFLGAVARVTGSAACRDDALRAIEPVRHMIERLLRDPPSANMPVGGLTGLGSLVYALSSIGRLLDEPRLIGEAHRLTAMLTPETIAADVQLDVTDGTAGTILGLLSLDTMRSTPNTAGATPLELARACGRHLLRRQEAFDGRPRAWAAPDSRPLAGFAHGAAGISYALARLHREVGEPDFLAGAREGLEFERCLYDSRAGNWRDNRFGDVRFQTSWCHGAPGIALGRLGALDVLGDRSVLADIDAAIQTALRMGDTPVDHLCCGNMGRVELFSYAGRRLAHPDLRHAAHRLAQRVMRRAEARGGYGLSDPNGPFHPGLFRGAAGVGLTLLRLVEPETLPCPALIT